MEVLSLRRTRRGKARGARAPALARVDEMPQAGQMTRYAAHHVAMLQVMTMRAAGAMAVNPMVDMQLVTAKDYRKTDPKVSIYIQAYLRLSAELRRFIKSLETKTTTRVELPKQHDHLRRASHDTSLLPEDQAEIHEHRLPTMQRAFPVLRDASYEARNGSKKKARELLDKAKQIDTSYIANLLDPLGPFWDTTYESLLPLTKGP
ncbi:MAG: hypothetical protein HUU46_23620 [Candidatus Hydrogenedentes bacterium]|nr:hypothetical protein [Candidatus Hydrogenedentota bacterium]